VGVRLGAMLNWSDAVAGKLARVASTLGQCAVVALGVHLAADSLDDQVMAGMTALQALADLYLLAPLQGLAGTLGVASDAFIWWDEIELGAASAWIALFVEAVTTILLWGSFVLTPRQDALSWSRYRRALSVRALILPLVLAGVILAGCWSLSMGVEDLLPRGGLSPWSVGLLGLAVLARFGWPAWVRAVAALEPSRSWAEGLSSAVVLAPVGALAWIYGIPLWGLLP